MKKTIFILLLLPIMAICQDSLSNTRKFFITGNIRLINNYGTLEKQIPYSPQKSFTGFGVSTGLNIVKDKISYNTGIGLDNYINTYLLHTPTKVDNFSLKHIAIYFTNKFIFSKQKRRIQTYLLTDVGWSFLLNKQEIVTHIENFFRYGTETRTPKNGWYFNPGFGLLYKIKKHSVSLDLCFNYTVTKIEHFHEPEFLIGPLEEEAFLLVRTCFTL